MIVDEYGLCSLQEGMLFNHVSGDRSGVDMQQIVIGYKEPVDAALLEQAWRLTVARHPALRTSFEWKRSSDPVQQVHDQVELNLEVQEDDADEASLERFLASDRARDFDLSAAPPMRLTLFKFSPEEYWLVWTVHHIVVDGRAFILVLNDVETYYQKLRAGEAVEAEPGPAFRPYIAGQRGLELAGADEFWAGQFKGLAGPTPLLEDPEALGSASRGFGRVELRLSEETTLALRAAANSCEVTLNTMVMAAWGIVLSRYSGEQEVVFGAAKTARWGSVAGAEAVVGLFLHTVPVRLTLAAEAPVATVLKELRSQWISLRRYETTPVERIREASGFAPASTLFDSLVVFERQSLHTAMEELDGRWRRREVDTHGQARLPLTLSVYGDAGMLLKLGFDGGRFTQATAQRMLGHMRQVLESIAADPRQKLSEISLLTAAEREQILVEWTNTAAEYPRDKCVHQLFEEQVARTPEAVALVGEKERLSYAELNRRANQLAHYLRELGVGPEVPVGLCVERSPEMIVGLLAVLKSGGAYIPLDSAYPAERLRFMIEDAAPAALLTQTHLREVFSNLDGAVTVLDMTEAAPAWRNQPESNPDAASVGLSPGSLAYIIYTSGSTGKPKGVLEGHRGLCNLVYWYTKEVPLSPRDVILLASSISFDLTFKNIYGPLVTGGQIWLTPNRFDPQAILSAIGRTNEGLLNVPPTAFYSLMEADRDHQLSKLRTIVMGGETIQLAKMAQLREPRPQILNTYGPTEITGSASFHRLRPALDYGGRQTPPIGHPLPNVRVYILDEQRRPVPIGVMGEIYIGGIGVARGYLNRPELTAERFLADPFSAVSGATMYRSGDLGRWQADGTIDFLGRNDFQVKIRGIRIELGEIEARLMEHSAVREAAVVAREDEPGDKRLVAYYLAAPHGAGAEEALRPEQLRRHMAESLPEHMAPAAYVRMEAWPRTPSGKLDRLALPAPGKDAYVTSAGYEPPQGTMETELAGIWTEVLKMDRIGRHENFFALGGHSLSAMQVMVRLRKAFDLEVPVACIFQNPTIESFAEAVDELHASMQSDAELLRILGELEAMPETSAEGAGLL